MGIFYEDLRESRLASGLSLEDISNITKINPKYLHAIEEGDYDVLPEPYIVLFIKAYAKEIGLNPDETAELYREHRRSELTPREQRKARIKLAEGGTLPTTESSSKPPYGILVAGLIFIIALIFSMKYCTGAETGETAETTAILQTPSEPVDDTRIAAPDTTISDTTDEIEANPAAVIPEKPLVLSIVSLTDESVWVNVIPDEDTEKASSITFRRRDEEQTWIADDRFSLRIGKTRGVSLILNGVELPPLGPEDTWVSRALITRQGIVEDETILRTRN